MNKKYYITIGRQFGSNGRKIGSMLAKKLNISYFDKEIINIASKKSGLNKELFENADEKTSHSLMGGLFGFRNSMLDEVYSGNYLCNETLFSIQSDVIRDIATEQSAVLVGRCADYILKDEKNCLNIFIYADMADRIKWVSERYDISIKESHSLIHKTDKRRSEYYNYYTSKEWGDVTSYDLCINSSNFVPEEVVDILYDIIIRKFL